MVGFSPHGGLDITIENNLIMIDARGPWNIEYLDQLHGQLLQAITKVDINKYGVLITLRGDAISVGDGFEYHLNFIRKGNTKAVAINLSNCTTALLSESIFSKLYQKAGVNHAFFDNSADAYQWLESQLALTTNTVM